MPDDIGSKPQSMAAAPASSPAPAAANGARRKRLFLILGGVVVVAGLIWGLYWVLVGSRHVATDNAYVNADTAQVTALVSGPIVQTPVGETAVVKKGQVIAVIDPAAVEEILCIAVAVQPCAGNADAQRIAEWQVHHRLCAFGIIIAIFDFA